MLAGVLLAFTCKPISEDEDEKNTKDTFAPQKIFITPANSYDSDKRIILSFNEQVTMVGWQQANTKTHNAVLYLAVANGSGSGIPSWNDATTGGTIKPNNGQTTNGKVYAQEWIVTLKGVTNLTTGDHLYPKKDKITDTSGNPADASVKGKAVFTLPSPDTANPTTLTNSKSPAFPVTDADNGYLAGKLLQLAFNKRVTMKGWTPTDAKTHNAVSYLAVTNDSGGTAPNWNDATTGGTIQPSVKAVLYDGEYYAQRWLIILAGTTNLSAKDKLYPKTDQIMDIAGNVATDSATGKAVFTLADRTKPTIVRVTALNNGGKANTIEQDDELIINFSEAMNTTKIGRQFHVVGGSTAKELKVYKGKTSTKKEDLVAIIQLSKAATSKGELRFPTSVGAWINSFGSASNTDLKITLKNQAGTANNNVALNNGSTAQISAIDAAGNSGNTDDKGAKTSGTF